MVDLEYVKSNIKDGWMLNPNQKVVEGIIKGINRCNGDCPCHNTSDEKKCPCSGYRLHDHCCCTLYVNIDEEYERLKNECEELQKKINVISSERKEHDKKEVAELRSKYNAACYKFQEIKKMKKE